jgi:hypothetical protein
MPTSHAVVTAKEQGQDVDGERQRARSRLANMPAGDAKGKHHPYQLAVLSFGYR